MHKNTGKSEIFIYAIFSDFGSRLPRENIAVQEGLELGIEKENAINSYMHGCLYQCTLLFVQKNLKFTFSN